jgi:hypothetical protein
VVVVGPVGASKTSLLMAMMGELAPIDLNKSQFSRKGTLAYCSQEPWIMSTTVSYNGLFYAPHLCSMLYLIHDMIFYIYTIISISR